MAADLAGLRDRLAELGRVVVAFSGGADSALLAWVATDVLGPVSAIAVTAVSPSLAVAELADCRALAAEWQLNYQEVQTHELDRPEYAVNTGDRCWHCKDELMRQLSPLAAHHDALVVLGVNLDDLSDFRPGQVAARAGGAVFPLADVGFTKADVREVSRRLGLRTWDKPAAACLSSRIPYGTTVSLSNLGAVGRAEEGLRQLGFRALRVRHYGELARIEVLLDDLEHVIARRTEVVAAVRAAGYRYVTLDLEGLRSGNLNDALAVKAAP